MSSSLQNVRRPAAKVFVATTVMLTFISFWRAAAIVLSDLASSAYYAGGDAEKVIGKSAPWFILAVMLFSYAVRALYIESSSMFVRGGVYRVVKEAMGGTLAKFSVSALLFDYVLTGPISAVSAGQYLGGFIQDIGDYLHHPVSFSLDHFSAGLAIIVVLYFWRKNIQGIHESSEKALQIMIITTVMVVILILWCTYTVFHVPIQIPPQPAAPRRRASHPRIARLVAWHMGQPPDLDHRVRGVWPFRPRHERRRDAGAGQSRNRTSQAEEPGKNRLGDLHLQPVVHFAGVVLRSHDYSRQGAAGLLRQPYRRHHHVPGRPL